MGRRGKRRATFLPTFSSPPSLGHTRFLACFPLPLSTYAPLLVQQCLRWAERGGDRVESTFGHRHLFGQRRRRGGEGGGGLARCRRGCPLPPNSAVGRNLFLVLLSIGACNNPVSFSPFASSSVLARIGFGGGGGGGPPPGLFSRQFRVMSENPRQNSISDCFLIHAYEN